MNDLYSVVVNDDDLTNKMLWINDSFEIVDFPIEELLKLKKELLVSSKEEILLLFMSVILYSPDIISTSIIWFLLRKLGHRYFEYLDKRHEIVFKDQQPVLDKLMYMVAPVVKEQVDTIIFYWFENDYSDTEIRDAILDLQDFFIQKGWDIEWELACLQNDSLVSWLEVFE